MRAPTRSGRSGSDAVDNSLMWTVGDARGAGHSQRLTVEDAVGKLDLESKVRLLTGCDTWHLYELRAIGLGPLAMSDGPVGIRGTGATRATALLFPSPSALAATWDPELARTLGRLFAVEARRHGA